MILLFALGALGCHTPEPLPDYGEVPAFELLDQEGHTVRLGDLRGSVWLANFIFTSCPNVCPTLSATMASVVQRFPEEPNLRFVSFSVDPETDTPPVLATYGARFGADPRRWSFLTGEPEKVRAVVMDGMKQVMEKLPPGSPSSVMHGERFVLVDRVGHIRGFPDPKEPELAEILTGIRALLAE